MAELTPEQKAANEAKAAADKAKKAKGEELENFNAEAKKPGRYIVGENLVDANGVIILPVPKSE